VCSERHAAAQILWELFFEYGSDFREILNDDFEVRKFAGKNCIIVPSATTELQYINKCFRQGKIDGKT
jgi:hypothetical protein